MVFLDDWVKDLGEILIGITISSIDTTMLVIKLDGTGDGLGQGEAGGGGLVFGELVPLLLGHMLGNQRMLRLDSWKFGHCWKLESMKRSERDLINVKNNGFKCTKIFRDLNYEAIYRVRLRELFQLNCALTTLLLD